MAKIDVAHVALAQRLLPRAYQTTVADTCRFQRSRRVEAAAGSTGLRGCEQGPSLACDRVNLLGTFASHPLIPPASLDGEGEPNCKSQSASVWIVQRPEAYDEAA